MARRQNELVFAVNNRFFGGGGGGGDKKRVIEVKFCSSLMYGSGPYQIDVYLQSVRKVFRRLYLSSFNGHWITLCIKIKALDYCEMT